MPISLERILDSGDTSLFDVRSRARVPQGSLPITPEMLLTRPSGDLFGWAQNAGMGWNPSQLGGPEILILSTHGGIRDADGTGGARVHTGHWEVGLLMDAAAKELKSPGACRSPRHIAPIPATAAPKAPQACSTACRIATTPPRYSAA
jgi:hypothetical protein